MRRQTIRNIGAGLMLAMLPIAASCSKSGKITTSEITAVLACGEDSYLSISDPDVLKSTEGVRVTLGTGNIPKARWRGFSAVANFESDVRLENELGTDQVIEGASALKADDQLDFFDMDLVRGTQQGSVFPTYSTAFYSDGTANIGMINQGSANGGSIIGTLSVKGSTATIEASPNTNIQFASDNDGIEGLPEGWETGSTTDGFATFTKDVSTGDFAAAEISSDDGLSCSFALSVSNR